MLTIVEIFDGYLQAALGKVAFSYGLAKLFVGEKRQKDFTFLTDETQESSPRISLTFFKIGIADNNCFDGRILNFRICLGNGHPVNVEGYVLDRRIALSQSNQTR